jgi:hypothetical protein
MLEPMDKGNTALLQIQWFWVYGILKMRFWVQTRFRVVNLKCYCCSI